jgi:predicted O-methyltransferase YrrM
MKQLAFLLRYVKYLIKAKSRYFIHSTFVFDFVNEVLRKPVEDIRCRKIEHLRLELKRSKESINVKDLGAGQDRLRSVGEIARFSAKQKRMAEVLHNIVRRYEPKKILELGTSLGISSMYQAAATNSTVLTIEGCPETAVIAQKNFNEIGFENIEQYVGNFDELMPDILARNPDVNYCFVDGNHTYDATIRYFNLLLSYAGDDMIMVFDDIHWSEGMEKAWSEIKRHEKVSLTIDLFFIGIVFFRAGIQKQDFVLYA